MMRANFLVAAAFVAVMLLSCDSFFGSIAVAAGETTATAGGGEGETSSHGTRMTTGVKGVPATATAHRKLSKNTKPLQDGGALSKEDALVHKLVFEKVVDAFGSIYEASYPDVELGNASYPIVRRADNAGRALQFGPPCDGSCISAYVKKFFNEECDKCLIFFGNAQQLTPQEQSLLCQKVVSLVVSNNDLSEEQGKDGLAYCTSVLMPCASSTATPSECCQQQSRGLCS